MHRSNRGAKLAGKLPSRHEGIPRSNRGPRITANHCGKVIAMISKNQGPRLFALSAAYFFGTLSLLFSLGLAMLLFMVVFDGWSLNPEKLSSAIGGVLGFFILSAVAASLGMIEREA